MTDHVIRAELLPDNRIKIADRLHNPLEVEHNDTVRWEFRNSAGTLIIDARIDFRGFVPKNRMAPLMGPPKHPFTSLQSNQLKIGQSFTVADTDPGLYVYVILLDNRELDWEVHLIEAGSFISFFGGIIIRDPGTSGPPPTTP